MKFSTLFRQPSNSNFRYLCSSTVYFRLSFQVKASSFVGLNEKRELVEGKGEAETAASTIHTGVHQARPDAVCAFHLHTPYATAIGKTQEKMTGQRGNLRPLAGICHVYESYF